MITISSTAGNRDIDKLLLNFSKSHIRTYSGLMFGKPPDAESRLSMFIEYFIKMKTFYYNIVH